MRFRAGCPAVLEVELCLVVTEKSELPSRLEAVKRTTLAEYRVQASSGGLGMYLIGGFSGEPHLNIP